jgi:hypothetical protein
MMVFLIVCCLELLIGGVILITTFLSNYFGGSRSNGMG